MVRCRMELWSVEQRGQPTCCREGYQAPRPDWRGSAGSGHPGSSLGSTKGKYLSNTGTKTGAVNRREEATMTTTLKQDKCNSDFPWQKKQQLSFRRFNCR